MAFSVSTIAAKKTYALQQIENSVMAAHSTISSWCLGPIFSNKAKIQHHAHEMQTISPNLPLIHSPTQHCLVNRNHTVSKKAVLLISIAL